MGVLTSAGSVMRHVIRTGYFLVLGGLAALAVATAVLWLVLCVLPNRSAEWSTLLMFPSVNMTFMPLVANSDTLTRFGRPIESFSKRYDEYFVAAAFIADRPIVGINDVWEIRAELPRKAENDHWLPPCKWQFAGFEIISTKGMTIISNSTFIPGTDRMNNDGFILYEPRYLTFDVPVWFIVAIGIWPAFILNRALRPWRRRKRGLCEGCGYDLQGNVSGVCSECGKETTKAPRHKEKP